MPRVQVPSTAGIVESKSGERHIPSSTRADGTKRKEIKIRPGFKPVEDVEIYKNPSADILKTSSSREIPGAQGLVEGRFKNTVVLNKNAKKRAAKKKSKFKEDLFIIDGFIDEACNEKAEETVQADSEIEREKKEKKARNLRKKLKQARELEEKKEMGSNLLPEQLAKIIKINELIRELNALDIQSKIDENEDTNSMG